MIHPAEIPQIQGDMGALTQHAAALSQVGTAFEDTGARVHGTWQGLAPFYIAPEAEQLMAATAPIPSITASIGEDLRSVGSALSGYAAEVTGIQTRLRALHGQALEFVAFAAANPDWLGSEADVDRHNQLLAAVNAAVADFQDAERRCANRILALYTDRRYVVDNGDGVLEGDEHGFTAATLGALEEADALPWGRAERHDRGFWGDVGAFGLGLWDGLVATGEGLAALGGLSRDGFSWETAGAAWSGVGMFALAFTPVGIANHYTDTFGIEQGQLGELVEAAALEMFAYDMWDDDPARAAGQTTFNVLSTIVGTKGAGAALRVTGTAAAASRIAPLATAGCAAVRVLDGVGRLPSVSGVVGDMLVRFPGLDIPAVALPPVIDLPPTHVDPPRIDPPPLPPPGSAIADDLPPARPEGGPGSIAAPAEPPARPDGGVSSLSAPQDPPPPRPDNGIEALTEPNEPPPPRPDNGVGTFNEPNEPSPLRPDSGITTATPQTADAPAAREPAREPVLAARGAAEPPVARPAGADASFGNGAGQFDLAPEGRAPDGPTASTDRSAGAVSTPDADRPAGSGPMDSRPDRTTSPGDVPTPLGPGGGGPTGDPGAVGARIDGSGVEPGPRADGDPAGGPDPDPNPDRSDGPPGPDSSETASDQSDAASIEDADRPTPDPTDPSTLPPVEPGPTADLGHLPEDRVGRGRDGLIDTVDGRPVNDFLRDLAQQRAEAFREARGQGQVSRGKIGNVTSVAIDRRTGAIIEGTNGRERDIIQDADLHELLRARLNELRTGGPYPVVHPDGTYGPRTQEFPYPDHPLGHAEVKAVNELLRRRGLDVDESAFSELRVHNIAPFNQGGQVPKPCCVNCSNMLGGTPSNVGRYNGHPSDPNTRLLEE